MESDLAAYSHVDGLSHHHIRRRTVTERPGQIPLKLTPEQQEQVREATGKLTDTLELSIMELEERIAPGWKIS